MGRALIKNDNILSIDGHYEKISYLCSPQCMRLYPPDMKLIFYKIIALVLGMLFITGITGCGNARKDKRLVRVSGLIDDSLSQAHNLLKDIDRDNLSSADRHFYDFLSLKIDDKNYVVHISDSLYLSINKYYSNHRDGDLYPEVLYYGGRVYSDMGDYPTALRYFQDALDALPENTDNLDLKSRILSQTGRLLNHIHLYTEAEKYLKENIKLNRIMKEEKRLMFNLQLLGSISKNQQNLSLARNYYEEAYQISKNFSLMEQARAKMYLAGVENELGNTHHALTLIQGVPETVNYLERDQATAYACDIYYSMGRFDSAYMYCKRLIDKPSATNRQTAFSVLLSAGMVSFIPKDSLSWYAAQYNDCIKEYINQFNSTQAELQVSAYNYAGKQRELDRLEDRQNGMLVWGLSGVIVILLLSGIVIFILTRGKIKDLKHRAALEKIRYLQERLKTYETDLACGEKEFEEKENNFDVTTHQMNSQEGIEPPEPSVDKLDPKEERLTLRNQLREVASSLKEVTVPSQIIESEVYGLLQLYVKDGKVIPQDSPIWEELSDTISSVSPNFKRSLTVLMNGKTTKNDYETCLLIKCGVGPTGMGILLGKSPGAIVSRRDSISQKIFDEKIGTKLIDIVIRLL